MTLDLIVRGIGSSRSPAEHLAAVLPEYSNSRFILYGQSAAGVARVTQVAADPQALAQAVKDAGEEPTVIYGDESLLSLAQHLQPEITWITLGSDANGVREIWRVRQQHAWLTGRKLGLVIEQMDGSPAPDTDRLMRLSRAAKAVLVPTLQMPLAQLAAAVEPAVEAAVEAEPVVAEIGPEETVKPEPAVTAVEPEVEAESEPVTQPARILAAAPVDMPVETAKSEGADAAMFEANEMDRSPETAAPTNTQAEQALMQRYTLVKERRNTAARITQVEAAIQGYLKEIFVSRFVAGPDAAAAFEGQARKLADAAAEFTQLSRSMATIEQQLAKLAWLKEELEI